jgi:hypothetical protein
MISGKGSAIMTLNVAFSWFVVYTTAVSQCRIDLAQTVVTSWKTVKEGVLRIFSP